MKINVKDFEKCETFWQKVRGLMFRRGSKPLLFIFKKPTTMAIHSFFCKKFLAVWILDGKVVDVKIVKPWRVGIAPKKEFDKLLEIPFESESEIKQFLVGGKKSI